MLEAKLVKGSLFHNLLESILDVTDAACVECFSNGLKLQCVDTEKVGIIELFFPAEDFKQYSCDQYMSMGIPIDDLVNAIRLANQDDNITIKVGDENFDTITLLFESPNINGTLAYDLRLVGAENHGFDIPDWQDLDPKYQAFVQMPSAQFARDCKYLCNIGGDGDISVTEKGVRFFASGTVGRMHIKYMQPEVATATIVNMREPVTVTVDLKYMNFSGKASTLFDQVKICLSKTQPLVVECKIGKMGYIRYFVAPKLKPDVRSGEVGVEKSIEMKEQGSGEVQEGKRKGKIKGSKSKEDIKEDVSGEEKKGKRKRLKRKGSKSKEDIKEDVSGEEKKGKRKERD